MKVRQSEMEIINVKYEKEYNLLGYFNCSP